MGLGLRMFGLACFGVLGCWGLGFRTLGCWAWGFRKFGQGVGLIVLDIGVFRYRMKTGPRKRGKPTL